MAQLGGTQRFNYCSNCVFIDIGGLPFRDRPNTWRRCRIFTSVRIMSKINKNEDMPEREAVEEAIDGSTMDTDSESVDSVARVSKVNVEAEETESFETSEVALEESNDEEADHGVSESDPSIEEADASDPTEPEAATKSDEASADDSDSEGEHKIDVGRAKWYTLRTFSGQEKKVRDSLLANIRREEMDDNIFEVLVPTENVIEMRDGKKRSRVKVFFPGYILVQMNLDVETQFLVEETYGVLNFIGPGNKPQEVKEKELRRILGDTEERIKRNLMAAPYSVGDSIKVIDGPFNDFAGYVQEINEEKQKVKVMVSIFGRATPVELDFLQVALEK